jgi:GTPase
MVKKQKPDFSQPVAKKQAEEKAIKIDEEQRNKEFYNCPVVVIAGRPNVGKSTLFNSLMKKKIAITDPTPGVTRDPVEGTAIICGKPVYLIDTGGYKLERDPGTKEAELDYLVVEKSLDEISRADLILLLLEPGVITAEDEELILRVRPFWKKVVAVINKTEGGRNKDIAYEYARFGFNELVFVSAEHGDHIEELSQQIVSRLDFSRVEESDKKPVIRLAIMGKPNTGKSTLSNRLTHSEASIVSDYAGTTRDVVEGKFSYNCMDFQVLDTAGIRKKAKVKENVEYYSVNRAIKTLDECDIMILMIDAQDGLDEQVKKICALAYERGRGIIFALNKWDTQEKGRPALKSAIDNIHIMFGQMEYAPVIAISALQGKGIKDLLDTAIELYTQLNRKIETSALNAALKDWLFQYPPPASKAIHFKIRYMTQTSVNPVSFLIFATKPEVVPQTYVTYLKNKIRSDLGYDKIPVQLEMKASRTDWESR